jgi:hypothetical protein
LQSFKGETRASPLSPSHARFNMRRQRAGTMKFLKQLIITAFALCVLAAGAMAEEPQKNGQKPPPPPKERQEVPKPDKPPPPRNNNNNGGNRGGNDNRRGRP